MLKLSSVFSNHMVLQQKKRVSIWGDADPASEITVTIQNQSRQTKADVNGNWTIALDALHASESEELLVRSGAECIRLEDVAVGEVFLAGGQSNMEFQMRYEKHLNEARKDCTNPRIRFFDVPEVSFESQIDCFDYSRMGYWRTATESDIEYFSAVGYYFQKELEECLDVPVGIIGCNWGGTASAAWISKETVLKVAPAWIDRYEGMIRDLNMAEYWERQKSNPMNDRGNPFADEFTETVMPRTLSMEEINAFFASHHIELGGLFPDPQPQSFPGSLYESMVRSIAPFTVRAVLWYQGESDDEAGMTDDYEVMLTALINEWRILWNEPQLPFLIVQLPGFSTWFGSPVDNHFRTIRKAQEEVTKKVPDTWLCSISDAGEEKDIHPKDKKTVGHRLALLARGHIYGEQILCDAPNVKKITLTENEVELQFENAGAGLQKKGDTLSAMHLFGGKGEMSFQSEIHGDTVSLIWEKCDDRPLLVSFAQSPWYSVNLYNEAGIPAVPFVRML